MSSTIGACHACDGGSITLSSSVEITCISKQYQVSGQSGFLAGDWDDDWDWALLNTSGFLGPFWLGHSIRQPLTWKQWLWIETLDEFIQLGARAHSRKQRYKWAHSNHVFSMVSWRSIYLPPTDYFADMGTLPTREIGTHQLTRTTRVAI